MHAVAGSARTALIRALDGAAGPGRPVVSVAPVAVDAPGRPLPLEVRVSAPDTGDALPVLLFSHGNGWSYDGYAPLTSFWASRGFVVVQATHLDSRRDGIGFDDPRFGDVWLERYRDLERVLDALPDLERALPGLERRVDRDRIVAGGHSWGAQTVQMLLGGRIVLADGGLGEDRRDPRIRAGVLLAATGTGGDELAPFARERFPFMNASFDDLRTPTLVVAGGNDVSRLSTRGPDWFTDAYRLAPGARDLLTLTGAEHSLGGIPGWEAAETTDEDPERVAVLQRLTTAWLRSAIDPEDDAWDRARAVIEADGGRVGTVDHR